MDMNITVNLTQIEIKIAIQEFLLKHGYTVEVDNIKLNYNTPADDWSSSTITAAASKAKTQ